MLNLIRKANEVVANLNSENKDSLALELHDQVDLMWGSRTLKLDKKEQELVLSINGIITQFERESAPVIAGKLHDAVDEFWSKAN